ncbi:MAG: DUF362 domain-containing protein [Acidobacteriota bacterium]
MDRHQSWSSGAARLAPWQATILRDREAAGLDDIRYQSPPERYAELPFPTASLDNPVYAMVRRLFQSMGLDAANDGTKQWNPLSELLNRGDQVLVKPNLVHHQHYRDGKLHWVVTDPRLVRAVCDYACLAVGREGHVIVGDAPLQSADWERMCKETQIDRLPVFYASHGYTVSLRDFRTLRTIDRRGIKCDPTPLRGDPAGYRAVDLGASSLHAGRDWRRFRVTNYNPHTMQEHHNAQRHEYLIARSLLSSPVVINLAKLKTHRKSGITGALKNMVGINGCKDWLPHHSCGSVPDGGDEYRGASSWKRLSSWLVEREETSSHIAQKLSWHAARRLVYGLGSRVAADRSWEGSWSGNDTLWRTILDLNRAALYADAEGLLQSRQQREILTIVDAIQAGEGEGPMAPDPVPLGCLIGAMHPLAAEIAAVRLAGWPEARLRHVQGAFNLGSYPLDPFRVEDLDIQVSDTRDGSLVPATLESVSRFLRPPSGWSYVQPALVQDRCRAAHSAEVGI